MSIKTFEDLKAELDKGDGKLFLHSLPSELYRSFPALSQSELKVVADKSPRHLLHQRRYPRPPTESMKLGTAAHCAILEADEFEKRYFAAPKADRRTKEGKAVWQKTEEWSQQQGVELLTEGEYESAMEMRDSVRENREIGGLLEDGVAERACIGHLHGVQAKSLMDFYRPQTHEIIDIKTTQSASIHDFQRDIRKYRYHWQAAWYSDLVESLTGEAPSFRIIAIENTAPYCAAVFTIRFDLMAIARREIEKTVAVIRKCEETGVWPGYRTNTQQIGAYKFEWEAFKKEFQEDE